MGPRPGTSEGTTTIRKLNATTFHPGDRILLKSGDSWTGQLWPKGSGDAEHPITVDKYNGDAFPVINGGGLEEDATTSEICITFTCRISRFTTSMAASR